MENENSTNSSSERGSSDGCEWIRQSERCGSEVTHTVDDKRDEHPPFRVCETHVDNIKYESWITVEEICSQ